MYHNKMMLAVCCDNLSGHSAYHLIHPIVNTFCTAVKYDDAQPTDFVVQLSSDSPRLLEL